MLSRRDMLQALSAAIVVPGAAVRPAKPDAAFVPAYFSPEFYPLAWEQLADPRLFGVVLNVASGPGATPDPLFAAAVRQIEAGGGTVAGYVDVGFGSRAPELVDAEARRYRQWYGVADVFLDQVPADASGLPYMQQVTQLLRGKGAEFVVFNHGTYPDVGYASLADLLVTFEGPGSAYAAIEPPAWTLTGDRQRFCHLVYGVPAPELDGVLALAKQRNTGIVYVTDHVGANPYGELPSYFPRLLSL
jgi:hypothetical protein